MVTQRFWKPLLLMSCGLGLVIAALKAVSKDSPATHSSPQPSLASAVSTQVLPEDKAIPRYEHIFVIIAENKAYEQIIGSPNAPHLNQLAKTYGSATQFYGEVHPSEANYVAMLGGSTFGIHDDDAYYCYAASLKPFCGNRKAAGYANHTIEQPSLVDQLQQHKLSWKGYFEDLPEPGSAAVIAPSKMRPLYASKHNGFMNFKRVQDDPDRAQKIVALPQLTTDLKSGKVPNYSHIILNQCQEMHGLSECPNTPDLIRTGDDRIAQVVQQIMSSSTWSAASNSAIVITWDEDSGKTSGQQGCCGYDPHSAANFGGGHIATIVITNHGRQHVTDSTPYNHYSLLRTTEDAFGIYEYLNQAGDIAHGVKPMSALFGKSSS
jgi:hypothetical protein